MATWVAGPGIQDFRLRGLAMEPPGRFANLWYTMENAMTSHRPAHKPQTNIWRSNRNMVRAGIGLAVVFAAVFAIGLAIGYTSVYRNVAIAVLGADTQSPGL